MTEQQEKDQEPWSPGIEGLPLFSNSADYERSLGRDGQPPELEVAAEGPQENSEEILGEPAEPLSSAETVSELARGIIRGCLAAPASGDGESE